MYGLNNLKGTISITETTVQCPVIDCTQIVQRQRNVFRCSEVFKCLQHRIYVSSSTFEYEDRFENILWKETTDRDLLEGIFRVKREISRIGRDNSEDAVTWNVFRFMENENLLQEFLSELTSKDAQNPEVIYWSYSQSEKDTWSDLRQAREEFEVNPKKGSEPDLIIKTSKALFFVEAKLTATNETTPSSNSLAVLEKYQTGGNHWYQEVFKSSFETIAIVNRKYELLRFWLLGSRIARKLGLAFFLVNLVVEGKEREIEPEFKSHIREGSERTFMRTTWENAYRYVLEKAEASQEKEKFIAYFKNKTVGYDQTRCLQKAFSVRPLL